MDLCPFEYHIASETGDQHVCICATPIDQLQDAGGTSCTNAYMLVYVRDCMYHYVMPALGPASVPVELVRRFAEEVEEEARRKRDALQQRRMMRVSS